MANLTLAIDDDLLRRARIKALGEDTSVNAWVREQLEDYVEDRDAISGLDRFLELAAGSAAASGSGGRSWTRDELYDRRVLRPRA